MKLKNVTNLEKKKKKLDGDFNDLKLKFESEQGERVKEEGARKKLQVDFNQLKDDFDAEVNKTGQLTKAKKTFR